MNTVYSIENVEEKGICMLGLFYFYLIPLTVINKYRKGSLHADLLVLGIKKVFWRWPVNVKNAARNSWL